MSSADECVVCGRSEEDFERGMAIGELTVGDVNHIRRKRGLDPVCSRACTHDLDTPLPEP